MRATIFLFLLLLGTAASARAQDFPAIPDSDRVLSQLEVKNFWINRLPEPAQPSRGEPSYQTLVVLYFQKVGERHRLIQAIRAGRHDRLARIAALRHNIQAYLLKGDAASASKLSAELAAIEAPILRQEKERADAERLERLIAANERLAAAIENNGGGLPDKDKADAQDAAIVPFERVGDTRRRRTYVTPYYVSPYYGDISFYRQPLIVHQRHHHTPGVSQRLTTNTNRGTTVHVHPSSGHPSRVTRPAVATPRQPQVRPVQAPKQPQVRPAR